MLCTKPLIEIIDNKLKASLNTSFISYKHFPFKKDLNKFVKSKKIMVYPCQSCIACVNMKRYHWVEKLKLEKQSWKYSYFVTLTYNNESLPNELKVSDLQKFIKYLRKETPEPIRYFACGEYGSKNKRPHYHMILFTNYQFDLEYMKTTKNGVLFRCLLFEKCWKHQGHIWVAHDLNAQSFAYVSTYSSKASLKHFKNLHNSKVFNNIEQVKQDTNIDGFNKLCMIDHLIDNLDFKKSEFIICSKKPPLGSLKAYDLPKTAPSTLLKWVENQFLLSIKDVKQEHLNNVYHKELTKRKNGYYSFVSHNDLYDLIESNKLLTDNRINKARKSKNSI